MSAKAAREGSANSRRPARNMPSLSRAWAVVVLAAMMAAYAFLTYRPHSLAYLDYGDGNYLYASHRMYEGAVLYAGIMGVQPPGIYVVGDCVFHVADSLAAIRTYSLALHFAAVLVVYLLGSRLTGQRIVGAVSAVLYTFAPYSIVWGRNFDPNPLVSTLTLVSVYCVAGDTRRWALGGGILGALALTTKVWYLPVCGGLILYMAFHRRLLLAPYVCGLLVCLVVIGAAGTASAGQAFWDGLLVQGSAGLSQEWFKASITHVLQDDWPLLALGLLGAIRVDRSAPLIARLMPFYVFSACLVILGTAKTGTAWPVFQFAEPALSVAAAAFTLRVIASLDTSRVEARAQSRLGPGGLLLGGAFVACAVYFGAQALRANVPGSDTSVRVVVARIQAVSRPGTPLVSPPYYVYLAGRREFGDFADVYLWAARAGEGDTKSVNGAARAVDEIRRGQIPIVVVDSRVNSIPGVSAALGRRYKRLPVHDPLPPDRAVSLWIP